MIRLSELPVLMTQSEKIAELQKLLIEDDQESVARLIGAMFAQILALERRIEEMQK